MQTESTNQALTALKVIDEIGNTLKESKMLERLKSHLMKIGKVDRIVRILMAIPLMAVFVSILAALGTQYDIQQAVMFSIVAFGVAEVLISGLKQAARKA